MYQIHPIKCGTLNSTMGSFTYLVDEGIDVTIPIISFLITSNDSDDDTIALVDTGLNAPDSRGQVHGKEVTGGGPEPLLRGLLEYDVTPSDIDYVIISHLHYDHTGNIDLFEGAKFFVQKDELESAADPLPPMRRLYDSDNIKELTEQDINVINGDYKLTNGIKMMKTPGHTLGLQSVSVDMISGTGVLVSDLAYCQHNLDPAVTSITDGSGAQIETTPVDYDYIAPGIHVDVSACYESMSRIRDRVGADATLIPGHEGSILGKTFE